MRLLELTMTDMTNHEGLHAWIAEVAEKTRPDQVVWCDGTQAEWERLTTALVDEGVFRRLDPEKRPNSFHALVRPHRRRARRGPHVHLLPTRRTPAPPTTGRTPTRCARSSTTASTVPCAGARCTWCPSSWVPPGSDKSHVGVQLTDSAYVVVSMRIMTRMGRVALDQLGDDGDFVKCLHSVGYPLEPGQQDVAWPCNEEKYITHFPETREIISYGSGYGGNALLGKKCFSLRIASTMAREEGWLAEHMLILKLTSPEDEVRYIAAAFPSACGKTNLAMMEPTIPGWKVETIGDDIAWMKFGEDGRLYAINPEAGFFGVAPGTSYDTNPNAMRTLEDGNTIYTNVALTDDGDVWWEEMTDEPPAHLIDWHGQDWTPDSERPARTPTPASPRRPASAR
jgi:phosphoenolpyruvate carboxykinase (GTP)